MPGDALFEDYDPDMEDVFGHRVKMTPKRVTVTEEQKNDPLRKPKVELQGILVAEKQPITAKDIERRMKDEYGQTLDPKKYGCNTLDDLLQACSDTIVHQKRRDGVHVYMAKVSEANQDIVEMVQQQHSGHEARRAPRSFFSSGGAKKGFGNHGASFRSYKGSRATAPVEVAKPKGSTDQLKARNKLGPAKTVARLENLAELLKECREEIGIPHPNQPGRKIVTLGALAEKFKQVYGLPAWGKNMTESELHKQIDIFEFSGVLSFWKLREDGDIFVESSGPDADIVKEEKDVVQLPPIEPKIEEDPLVAPEKQNGKVTVAPPSSQPTSSRPSSSIANLSFEDFSSIDGHSSDSSMLITEGEDDGFFESGPGFGGNLQGRPAQPTAQNGTNQNGEIADLAQRFGNTNLRPAQSLSEHQPRAPSNVSNAGSAQSSVRGGTQNKEGSSRAQPSSVQPMRPVHAAFGTRAIMPQNPQKLLVDYIKSRGSTKFEALPADDQVMVNFGKNIFKVYSENPGEMMVKLVDPAIDTSTLGSKKECLREPLEADFRWMTEASIHVKRGRRHFIKPVMFVAPRGFLVVINNPEDEDLDCDKMALMEDLLRGAMDGSIQELTRKKVRPGMPAVYIYRQGAEIRYYRVLIVGPPHQDGDVMVLLADHTEQYLADVQFSHLFELPEKISFKNYAPNVIFATLYGVNSLSIEEQQNMWRNFDDEERKRFIVGYVPDDPSKVLSIDMVMCDEKGQLAWLSKIAKRRGAVESADTSSAHVTRPPQNAIESFGRDCYMDFVDYSAARQNPVIQPSRTKREEESEPEEIPASETTITDDNDTVHTTFSPRNLNLYKLFDKFIADQDLVSVVALSQFVRSVKESEKTPEWEELHVHMVEVARRNSIRL
ncbi:unnamed protein product [Caenorhabditis brenneri]